LKYKYIFLVSTILLLNVYLSKAANDTTFQKPVQESSKIIKINGSAGITSDYISTTNSQGLDSTRRQFAPQTSLRGSLMLNVNLYDQVQLPFEVWYTTTEIGFQQPFNQFGVNPRIGNWLTLHAGYFNAKISDLSFGDSRIMGGGFELTPGNFVISGLYGRIRARRDADSSVQFPGEYKRMALALKFGYGKEGDVYANLNLVRGWDDSTSHFTNENAPTPTENFVTSFAFGAPISQLFRISGEAAISAFSNNIYDEVKTNTGLPSFVNNIFTTRYSSQFDGALKGAISFTPNRNFSLRLNTLWVGPGFQTIGYPQMPNDVFNVTLAPAFRLSDGMYSIKGSIGIQENNLRNNLLASTERIIGSLDLFGQVTQTLSINAQYSNYGMKTAMNRDTVHVQNIAQIISISPNLNFQWLGATNVLSLSYSFQDVSDRSSYDTVSENNSTNTLNLTYALLFENTLTLTTGVFYNNNKSVYSSAILSCNETAGYSFLDKKLMTSLTLGICTISTVNNDVQANARLTISYSMAQFGTFTVNFSNMNYMSGPTSGYYQGVPSYNEFQGTLQYGISF
jgi:hypothetical protein